MLLIGVQGAQLRGVNGGGRVDGRDRDGLCGDGWSRVRYRRAGIRLSRCVIFLKLGLVFENSQARERQGEDG